MRKRFSGILMIAMLITLGITAFASGGAEYIPGGKQYKKNRSDSNQGSQKIRSLSEDDVRKMNEVRDAFFKSTEKLRLDIYLKEIELNNELAKKEIDTEKALNLRKEISDFESKYNQKRIEYMINIKKINTDLEIQFGIDGVCTGNAFLK
jgi:uncharacterized protein YxeA